MAQLGTEFDATTVDPSGGFPLIAPGKYLAQIVASEMRVTKDGSGEYLQLEIEIIDGPEAGRKVFDRLNLRNSNQTTVQIAQRTLSQICHATGVMTVSDSKDLHARRMLIDVRVEPGQGQYRDQNRVVSYMPPDGSLPLFAGGRAAPVQASVPQPRSSGSNPPWRRSNPSF
jgi:Protein of unknown function (DUF669)